MKLISIIAVAVLTASPDRLSSSDIVGRSRAWTIDTDDISGGAVLRPKDHIDVLAVVTDPETKRSSGVLLLQNVLVLANAAPVSTEGRQLSLLVRPEEAVLLATARAHGQLTAILRNPEDPSLVETRLSVSVSTVVGAEPLPIPPPRRN